MTSTDQSRFQVPMIPETAHVPGATAATKHKDFNKYVEKLILYLNMITLEKKYPCSWTTIVNDEKRQESPAFPMNRGGTIEAKKKAHHYGQSVLMQALMSGLGRMPRFDAIYSRFPFTNYDDKDAINGGEPYPVATYFLKALQAEYAPNTMAAQIHAQRTLDNQILGMPLFHRADPNAFITWLDSFVMNYQQIQQLNVDGHAVFNEGTIMEKFKRQLYLNFMQSGSISITRLETEWATQPPTTLDGICQTIHIFCKIMDVLDDFSVPAPQPAAVVNFVPTPPTTSDKICLMCTPGRAARKAG